MPTVPLNPPKRFILFETETFREQLDEYQSGEQPRIEHKLEDLERDPYRKTIKLEAPFLGHRRFRIGDDRVVFTVCEECRKHSHQAHVKCEGCPGKPGNIVTLRFVGGRGSIYDG